MRRHRPQSPTSPARWTALRFAARYRQLAGLLVGGALLSACTNLDVVGYLTPDASSDASGPNMSLDSGGGDLSSSGDYCAGSGPPILVGVDGGTGGEACTGRLAAVAFRYGLCTCQALNTGAGVTVDSYDSQMGMTPKSLGGSVGLNGPMASSSPVSISGSLLVGDPGGLSFTTVSIGQQLRSAGSAVGSGALTVGTDAFVNGDANVGGALSVGGILTLPAGKIVAGTSVPARIVRAPVTVAPPCDCSPGSLVNVAGYISQYRQRNDNAAIFLDPDRLKNLPADTTLALPCGRYYLNSINGDGALTLQVNGRVALFIGGDVQLQRDLTITLAQSGELDLFIGGTLNSSATLRLGNKDSAARLRLYFGGATDISLSGQVELAGNLYAPLSQLSAGAGLTVYGALFVRRLAISGPLQIHHDAAVFRAGDGCPAPTPGCGSCRDCGNQACVGGACGRCTDSSQCCSPLECKNGQCVYYLG